MKTTLIDLAGSQPKQLSLQQLVSRLLADFQPAAVRQQSFFLNDVSNQFFVNTDEKILESVMSSLFSTVINLNKNACIRVSANTEKDFVEIQLKNKDALAVIPQELEAAKPLAEKIEGIISMNQQPGNTSIVCFRFRNPPIAA